MQMQMLFAMPQRCGQSLTVLAIPTVITLILVLSTVGETFVSASMPARDDLVVPGYVIRHGTVPLGVEYNRAKFPVVRKLICFDSPSSLAALSGSLPTV